MTYTDNCEKCPYFLSVKNNTENIIKIPFNSKGELISWVPGYEAITWRENFIFYDVLLFEEISLSLKNPQIVRWKSTANKKTYPMFFDEFASIIKTGINLSGQIAGYFTFIEKNQHYGIIMFKGHKGKDALF